MADTMEKVNRGIRILLVSRGMKQTDLMRETGIKPNYFSRRINGHRDWTLSDLDKIADAFGLGSAARLMSISLSDQAVAA